MSNDDRVSELLFIDFILNNQPLCPDDAIDIGANIGFYTLLLSSKFGMVHAFEPIDSNLDKLNNLVSLSRMENISIHQKVVSNHDGPTKMAIGPNFATSTINLNKKEVVLWDGIAAYNQGINLVEGITLNSFCQNKKVAFIKCDIEGGEDLIFDEHCAGRALTNLIPSIALETHTDVNLDKVYRNLWQYGYRTFRSKDGLVNYLEPSELYIITK